MIKKECMDNLFKQFIESRYHGYNIERKHIDIIKDEFSNWIKERKQLADDYSNFLLCNSFEIDKPDVAEIGKCFVDSSSKDLNNLIITPYTNGFENCNNQNIIYGRLTEENRKPFIVAKTKIIDPKDLISTYMTQNPYNFDDTVVLNEIFRKTNNNCIIGMYGSISDADYEKKVKLIELLSEDNDNYSEMIYDTNNGNYFVATGNRTIIKQKFKCK